MKYADGERSIQGGAIDKAMKPREMLKFYIESEYSSRDIRKYFGNPRDEGMIKKAASYVFMDVPTYLRTYQNFYSEEAQDMLKEKADWFFGGLKKGSISVFYNRAMTEDLEYLVTIFGLAETTDGKPLGEHKGEVDMMVRLLEKTVEKVVSGKA